MLTLGASRWSSRLTAGTTNGRRDRPPRPLLPRRHRRRLHRPPGRPPREALNARRAAARGAERDARRPQLTTSPAGFIDPVRLAPDVVDERDVDRPRDGEVRNPARRQTDSRFAPDA